MKKMIMLIVMTMSLRLCEMTMLIAIESQGWGWMLSWSPMAACLPTPPMRCGRFVRKIKATTCTYYYNSVAVFIQARANHGLPVCLSLIPWLLLIKIWSCCLVLNLELKYRFKSWFWINSLSNISQGGSVWLLATHNHCSFGNVRTLYSRALWDQMNILAVTYSTWPTSRLIPKHNDYFLVELWSTIVDQESQHVKFSKWSYPMKQKSGRDQKVACHLLTGWWQKVDI